MTSLDLLASSLISKDYLSMNAMQSESQQNQGVLIAKQDINSEVISNQLLQPFNCLSHKVSESTEPEMEPEEMQNFPSQHSLQEHQKQQSDQQREQQKGTRTSSIKYEVPPRSVTMVYKEIIYEEELEEEADQNWKPSPSWSSFKEVMALKSQQTPKLKQIESHESYKSSNESSKRGDKFIYKDQIFISRKHFFNRLDCFEISKTHFHCFKHSELSQLTISRKTVHLENYFEMISMLGKSKKDIFSIPNDLHLECFTEIIRAKLSLMGYKAPREEISPDHAQKKGRILKRSQHLKKWELRDIVVNKHGCKSYKDLTKQPTISFDKIEEFWTNFNVVECSEEGYKHDRKIHKNTNYSCLVVKMSSHKKKYEVALPLYELQSWLKAFYSMLEERIQ